MLAKIWKKLGLIILIIVCLWNIVSKLIKIVSFDSAIETAKNQLQTTQNNNNTK